MKKIFKWLSKYYLWIIAIISIAITALVILLINNKNDTNLFSFWGSLLGGIFGGLATLIAFLVTSKQNKIENKSNRELQLANIEYSIKKEVANNWCFEVEQSTKEILKEIYPYDICGKLKEVFEQKDTNMAKTVIEKANNVLRKIRIEYSLLFNFNVVENGKGNSSCTKEENPISFSFQQYYDILDAALQGILNVSTSAMALFRKNLNDDQNLYFDEIDKNFDFYYFNSYQPLLKAAKKFLSEIKEIKNEELTKFIKVQVEANEQ